MSFAVPQVAPPAAGPVPVGGIRRAAGPRWALSVLLLVQAGLSVRLVRTDTAFQDEALYLRAGRLEWAHWLHHAPIPDFPAYFSGAPVAYPLLGALADRAGGLAAARLLSLAFMLGATALLWATTTRLYGRRAALLACGLFATLAGTQFLGSLATFDAPALFLLALATWLGVRAATAPELAGPARVAMLAGAGLVLAAADVTKYATALFTPVVIVVVALAVWRQTGHAGPGHAGPGRGWLTSSLIPLVAWVISVTAAIAAGQGDYWQGIRSTTLARSVADSPVPLVLKDAYVWTSLILVLAALGVWLAVRSRGRGRLLPAVLLAAALLAPAEQARLHTTVSLQKHVVFGAWFAAIAAGYALARLSRVDRGYGWAPVMALPIAAATLFGSMGQAHFLHRDWPDATALVKVLRPAVHAQPGNYLAEDDDVEAYYLRTETRWQDWSSTYYFRYPGQRPGAPSYAAAIGRHYFALVILDDGDTATTDALIIADLRHIGGYRELPRAGRSTVWVRDQTGRGTVSIIDRPVTGKTNIYLPQPPDAEEKYGYFGRPRRLVFAWLLIASAGVLYGYVHVAARAWLVSPLMWLLLMVMVPPVVVNFWLRAGRPRLTLADHRAIVAGYRPAGESVDVFLPSAGEPLALLDNTLRYASELRWDGPLTVYVLDDSARPAVRDLAAKYRLQYVVRPNPGELKKAGNLTHALQVSDGDFIVVIDADFAARPEFLYETMPYFADPAVGIVQTAQVFDVSDPGLTYIQRYAGTLQEIFFRFIQPARDRYRAAICAGTNLVYRRASVAAAGGFAQVPIGEDVHSGVKLWAAGAETRYLPLCLARGVAPADFPSLANQQVRWCRSSMLLMIDDYFIKAPLDWKQRAAFWAAFLYYMSSAALLLTGPFPALTMIWFYPGLVHPHNYLPMLPALAATLFAFPLVSRGWRPTIYRVCLMNSCCHLYSVWYALRDRVAEWVPTGASPDRGQVPRAVNRILCTWIVLVQLLLWSGLALRVHQFGWRPYWATEVLAAVQLYFVAPLITPNKGVTT